MIKSLHLVDFKVFHDQTFEFPSGITSIVGPNGSGKTTILEAIEFALFRSVTRKEKKVLRVEELIRHGKQRAIVDMEFLSPKNGQLYRVVRSIHPGTTNADLFHAAEKGVIETGPSRVDEEIVNLLGMDKSAFGALTYVRQGEIDMISRLAPKKRRESLYDMMGLGIYNKYSATAQKEIRKIRNELDILKNQKARLLDIRKHLPTRDELEQVLKFLEEVKKTYEGRPEFAQLEAVLSKVSNSLDAVQRQMSSEDLTEKPKALTQRIADASDLMRILDQIPKIAEEQLKPHIREEAREIFLGIFGDKYSDFVTNDDYEIDLYDIGGNRVSLRAASGGEDVCVNFALRVGVNTALQNQSFKGRAPGIIILDEPGAGLDAQRRRWLPDAIRAIKSVNQVIVVTHMEELRETANNVINITPQGKGRPPLVEITR